MLHNHFAYKKTCCFKEISGISSAVEEVDEEENFEVDLRARRKDGNFKIQIKKVKKENSPLKLRKQEK